MNITGNPKEETQHYMQQTYQPGGPQLIRVEQEEDEADNMCIAFIKCCICYEIFKFVLS